MFTQKVEHAKNIIHEQVEKHKPIAVYAGLSGGHDSLVCCHIAKEVYPECKILHINTGIGIEKTRQYVRDVCRNLGWNLIERLTKESYEEFVLEHGFPGPPQHNRMYQRLKERVVREIIRESKIGKHRNSRVMFITGIRAEESVKRAGYNRVESKVDAGVWINPIYYFTGTDKEKYIEAYDLPRNPVVELLGMSGECLCGAYSHRGEKELVRICDPETAAYIDDLEERVNKNGMPWKWEDPGPPKSYMLEKVGGQQNLFQPLCVGCQKVYNESA